MLHILLQIAKTGIKTEPAPDPDETMVVVRTAAAAGAAHRWGAR